MPRDFVQVRRPSGGQQYQAPTMRYGRSQIRESPGHKTSFDTGELIPYFWYEIIPGDTLQVDMMAFIRIWSPLGAPIMDNIEACMDYFYVPWRTVWTYFDQFLGAHDDAGAQDTDYTFPIMSSATAVAENTLLNYFGIPIGLTPNNTDIMALPIRAYHKIYNEWYRDQNLIDSIGVEMGNGPDSYANRLTVHKSAKKHDYFTSALPYLQKGTAQSVALSDAPVTVDLNAGQVIGVYTTVQGGGGYYQIDTGAATADLSTTTTTQAFGMYADLSNVGLSINALREAAAIQRLLERDARGGTRLPELNRAHFGVEVPDFRTQRAEYLGGGKSYINVSPVANTSATATENQGELAGIGTGTIRAGFSKSFVEHGIVIGILRCRGDVNYHQGLERMWSRSDRYDLLWPELAMLGEQPIYNKELYVQETSADDQVFGYQERYADYRYKKSLVTGDFAPDATLSLDFWHLAEDFGSLPTLGQTFIEDATPMARVTVVDSQKDFIVDGRFDVRLARALPVRPVPTLAPARF